VAKVMTLWRNLKTLLPAGTDAVALIAHAPAHLAAHAPKRARHSAPRTVLPAGSVAEFTELDSDSMEAYLADAPAPPKKSLGRWFARAFGKGR
jgi:hypothetical protein